MTECFFFFFNDAAPPDISPLPLHAPLPTAGRRSDTRRSKLNRLLAHVLPGGLLLLGAVVAFGRSEEHTSELQSRLHLVCRLLLEKKNTQNHTNCRTCAHAVRNSALPLTTAR